MAEGTGATMRKTERVGGNKLPIMCRSDEEPCTLLYLFEEGLSLHQNTDNQGRKPTR